MIMIIETLDFRSEERHSVAMPIYTFGIHHIISLDGVAIVPKGESGQIWRFMGLICPSYRTSFWPIPDHIHTGIGGFTPGKNVTTSVVYGSGGAVECFPRYSPAQNMPRNLQHTGPEGSLGGRCPHWGPPRRHGSYPGIVSAPPTITGNDWGFMVLVIPWLAAFVSRQQRFFSLPRSDRGSMLNRKPTPPASPVTPFWTSHVIPCPWWLFPWSRYFYTSGGCVSTLRMVSLSLSRVWGCSSLTWRPRPPGGVWTHSLPECCVSTVLVP